MFCVNLILPSHTQSRAPGQCCSHIAATTRVRPPYSSFTSVAFFFRKNKLDSALVERSLRRHSDWPSERDLGTVPQRVYPIVRCARPTALLAARDPPPRCCCPSSLLCGCHKRPGCWAPAASPLPAKSRTGRIGR